MAHHGHSHSCEGDANKDETPEMGMEYSLYKYIDFNNLECLNEKSPQSGKLVFKPWEQRLDFDKVTCKKHKIKLQTTYINKFQFVESDVDEELLFNVPFTGNMKLKGIIIIGGEDETHPSRLRL